MCSLSSLFRECSHMECYATNKNYNLFKKMFFYLYPMSVMSMYVRNINMGGACNRFTTECNMLTRNTSKPHKTEKNILRLDYMCSFIFILTSSRMHTPSNLRQNAMMSEGIKCMVLFHLHIFCHGFVSSV